MRQIVDPVAVEIEFDGVVPVVAETIYTPMRSGDIGATGFDRVKIVTKNVLGELVVVRIRANA